MTQFGFITIQQFMSINFPQKSHFTPSVVTAHPDVGGMSYFCQDLWNSITFFFLRVQKRKHRFVKDACLKCTH